MITRTDIAHALRQAGIRPGMTVFSHSNIAFFGPVEGAGNMDELIQVMLTAFDSVLGDDGTLVLPVFTYSFGSDKADRTFDVQNSLSTTSALGNWLITSGEGVRSVDPMLSVVARGAKAEVLVSGIDRCCFGTDSIWARLYKENAMICNLNLDSGSTFLHWVERELGVPYRSDVKMTGKIIDHGETCPATITYTGRNLNDPQASPRFEAYHAACLERGASKKVSLGRGQIISQSCKIARQTLENLLGEYPFLLTARHLTGST
ncbi:hypothetical protein HBA54_13205 [Pelagibius litoralis]|uniref:Aminoglycoside N(3)-acetyltransferase n=1 Tax=Pelagibius litoralis TaxID=374515 RepID=A0A967K704_9PROT|nr:AAC(3) family N-acetyltransferase [Pelagibius litoralis]NIA69553.1 hypothetical protein [Pelagibius litoralis]